MTTSCEILHVFLQLLLQVRNDEITEIEVRKRHVSFNKTQNLHKHTQQWHKGDNLPRLNLLLQTSQRITATFLASRHHHKIKLKVNSETVGECAYPNARTSYRQPKSHRLQSHLLDWRTQKILNCLMYRKRKVAALCFFFDHANMH